MAMQIYNVGLDALAEWETATYEFRAFSAITFDKTHDDVIHAIQTADEVDATGYAALEVAGKDRVVNDSTNRIEYKADNPTWTGLGPGDTIVGILLTKVVTDDNDSIPVGLWNISPAVATDVADPLVFDLAGAMVAYVDQAT